MKIAIVTERIETWRGGAETSTVEIARLLAAQGHDVHVVTSSRSPSPPDFTVHMVSNSTAFPPLRTAGFVRKAERLVERGGFDLVHAVVPMPGADVFQPRGGLIRESIRRNVALRPTASRRLLKRAASALNVKYQSLLELERATFRPDGPSVAAVSDYVARQCQAHYEAAAPRVRVVFNGVHAPAVSEVRRREDRRAIRAQYHVAEDALLLLFVAHNFRLKGLAPLLEIASVLRRRGLEAFRLLIVGRDNPARFHRRIVELDLERHVSFSGPTQGAAAFFHAADVCVHPTYYDPCSRVVLEALARGLPCITTRHNGAAEAMRDGEHGFVVDEPDDVDAWVRRILELRDPAVRRRMSEASAALRERVSMTRHVRELQDFFQDVLNGRSHRIGRVQPV